MAFFVNPTQDTLFVIAAQVQIFKPHQAALIFCSFNDSGHVGDTWENGLYKSRLSSLRHRETPSLRPSGIQRSLLRPYPLGTLRPEFLLTTLTTHWEKF